MGKTKERIKARLKQFFYTTGAAAMLDKLLYRIARIKNGGRNRRFRMNNVQLPIPPDYFLYETYRLDYKMYVEDGQLTAKEIIHWTDNYVAAVSPVVLEWGCGVGRIIRHLGNYLQPGALIYGCDINEEMIAWNKENLTGINFSAIAYNPPTPYASGRFSMIYAISVFTHIEADQQLNWLQEIHRILQQEGIFLFTTHGEHYTDQLLPKELQLLNQHGSYTKSYYQKGHRMMSTYQLPEKFAALVRNYFTILEYHNGEANPTMVGGQDLWIVRKRSGIVACA